MNNHKCGCNCNACRCKNGKKNFGPTGATGSTGSTGITGATGDEGPCDCPPVPTITALAALFGPDVNDDSFRFVQTVLDWFRLDRANTFTPDGITIVPAVGGGNWIRQIDGDIVWFNQPEWFIDPVNGNDENDGATALTALETPQELQRRYGWGYPFLPGAPSAGGGLHQQIVINILNNIPDTNALDIAVRLGPNTLLAIIGTATVIDSGTFTAVVPVNRAGNTHWTVTDPAINWALHVGKRIRVPSTNQLAWVAADLGGGTAAISAPNNPNLPPPPDDLFLQTVIAGVFAVGEQFVIEDLTTVPVNNLDIKTPNSGNVGNSTIGFADIYFQRVGTNPSSTVINPQGNALAVYKGCRFESFSNSSNYTAHSLINCGIDNASPQFRCSTFFLGGLSRGIAVQSGAVVTLDFDHLIYAGTGLIVSLGVAIIGTAGIFNAPAAGVQVGVAGNSSHSAALRINSVAGQFSNQNALYGAGNARGMDVQSNCSVEYQTIANVTITGAGGDFRLAVAVTARAWNEGGGVYTAPFATTWANVAANFGNAHNLERNSHLVQRA